ncbi:MAG: 6-phosphofructokinase isozyme 2 [Daejeonella sp.]|nr:6-phosphofructokinase isozyme 2 [Daejeonella sp.]
MKVITLTINPALDKSAKVDQVKPEQKLRCHSIVYQPGGGGINISRVLQRLGVSSNCVFTAGGGTGKHLNKLLQQDHIKTEAIFTAEPTRENFSVIDTSTGFQYRFGMPGTPLTEDELELIKKTVADQLAEGDFLVLSGSLAENTPANFYSSLIKGLSDKKVKVILDSSGAALKESLKENLFLIKPNQNELAQLAGKENLSLSELENCAKDLINNGKLEYAVVSLGAKGAFIASKSGIVHQQIPKVEVKSTIGAGDSMLAGIIYSLIHGFPPETMLKWGVACGVSATMSEGTDLARMDDVERVLEMLG